MNILVLGGLGFIGSNFCLEVGKSRPTWKLRVVDSFTYAANDPSRIGLPSDVDVLRLDIRDASAMAAHVDWSDVVVNFAAESHNDNSLRNPDLFISTNVLGAMKVAELCLRFSKLLHHVSTDEVYGDTPLDSQEEFTPSSQFRPSSPYSSSKASADLMLMAWHRSFGLRVNVSHCTNNFGLFQHSEKFLPRMISQIANHESPQVYGTGLNVRDWIHTSDHISGIVAVIESELIGERFHFGANDRLSNVEIVKRILQIMAVDLPIEFVPDRPGHDRRYALSFVDTAERLGWNPSHPKLMDSLPGLIEAYSGGEYERANS